ncbi:MAG: hypothetical protein GWO24_16820 [Akkermansiaceae bacterium]|nr:hypothetical protein [Akkermansiaceae bacterium]
MFFLLTLPLTGAEFVAPDNSKTLFRRDLVPIDTDTMRALSSHLTRLARREMDEQARQLRATAQLLAIAIRLDPANRPARDLSRRLAEGHRIHLPARGDLTHAMAETWQITDWLLRPEAGSEGHLLGRRIVDALHVIDPLHPLSRRHNPEGEVARWSGIVAGLDRFRIKARPTPVPSERSQGPPGTADPPANPVPPAPPVKRSPVLLRRASIQTPLFINASLPDQELRVVPLSMNIVEYQDPEPLTITLQPEFTSPFLDLARQRVRRSLEANWPHLPLSTVARLTTGGSPYAPRNGTAVSGPASLLLHAALTGKPLRREIAFVSDLREDGSLTRPLWSWDYIHALRSGAGGRLLVPPDLMGELLAMLVLEDPGFFLKWEVLVVRSLDETLELASEGADPEGVAAAAQMFEDVRRVSEGNDVGQLCVNLRVRERLREIQSVAPHHFSSAMLLLQGSGQQRPIRFERRITARILRSAVEPLAGLIRQAADPLPARRIDAAAQAARAGADRFAGLFETRDAALHQEAVAVTDLARALARASQLAKPDQEGTLITPEGVTVSSVRQHLQASFTAFLERLAPETGESIPSEADPTPNPPD